MSDGISWGKMIGGAVAITGAAVAGIGLGGDALAGAIGTETAVGGAVNSAADAVTGMGDTVVKALGLEEKISGKTAAAIIGGLGVAAGAGIGALTGKKDDDSEEKRLSRVEAELAAIKEALLLAMQQQQDQQDIALAGVPPRKPGGHTLS